jgi:simple sugar transport system permease protein
MASNEELGPLAPKGIGSDTARIRKSSPLARLLRRPELGALSGVILIYAIFFALAGDSGMFTIEGIINILQVSAEIGILAVAAALLMIAGEFDLSIGSMIGIAGVIIGLSATVYGMPLSVSFLVALVICAGIGALNGIVTVKTGLPSFIVTLASLLILRGLAISVTRYVNGYSRSRRSRRATLTASSSASSARRSGSHCSSGWRITAGSRPGPMGCRWSRGSLSPSSGGSG